MVSGFLIRLCLGVEIQTLKMAGVWSIKTFDFMRIFKYSQRDFPGRFERHDKGRISEDLST